MITRRDVLSASAATFAANLSPAVAQSAQNTFVLIHGAFVGGWCWRRVSDLLEKKGHKVFSPTFTGLGERSHLLSKDLNLDTHITDIVNVFKYEDLSNACLVAHSYGGIPSSGAIEQIAERVSSIVWLDAFKPENGQRIIDITSPNVTDPVRRVVLAAIEKGEAATPVPRMVLDNSIINERDRAWFEAKLTPDPTGTKLQPIKLTGARERVAKKTYIRALKYPNQALDKSLAECKADKSWRTVETTSSGHVVMIDAPEWLADVLVEAS